MKRTIGIIMVLLMLMSVTGAWAGNANNAQTGCEKVKVIIGYVDKPNQADEDKIRGHGGKTKYTYHIINAKAAEIPKQAIDRIKRNPRVTYVEEDAKVYALGETLPWGVDRIDAEIVHADNNKGTGVKVAIIDTGIDKDHPDIEANIKGGVNFVSTPPRRPADPDKWDDDNGHGTHCAGIVAAVDNEEGVIGVAPEADLYGVKVLDRTGSGYVSDVIAGIEWSIANGMKVISMSLGGGYSEGMETACYNAYNEAEIVVVASAGNSGPGDDTVSYPAKYDSVIAVSATDNTNTIASFSSRGLEVELAAPGVDILSTYPGGYAIGSGTSMACPHVAGTAALVIASGITDNEAVRVRLQETADDLGAGFDTKYGHGLVDADEAVPPAVPNTPPVADAGGSYSGTEDATITFDGSASYDGDCDSLTYKWDFGDGTQVTVTTDTATHTYTTGKAGETTDYTVKLIVSDGKEDSDPSTTTALVEGVNDVPVADAGGPYSGIVTDTVTFDGSGSSDEEGTISDYTWNFGDGSCGTGKTVIHTYTTKGTYTVTLTVTDGDKATDTATTAAEITEASTNAMHVYGIDMWNTNTGRNHFIYTMVTICDSEEAPVSEATVTLETTLPDSSIISDSGSTNNDGTVTFKLRSRQIGTYRSKVMGVVKTDWGYVPSENVETDNSTTI